MVSGTASRVWLVLTITALRPHAAGFDQQDLRYPEARF